MELSEGVVAKLPKLNSLKRTIQRQREKDHAPPTQPTSVEDLIIPLEYRINGKGDVFLLYDSKFLSKIYNIPLSADTARGIPR